MSYTEADLLQHPVWRHVKTNSLYHVIGCARCATNKWEGEVAVIYFSIEYQRLCYREVGEFLDGRFVPEPVRKI